MRDGGKEREERQDEKESESCPSLSSREFFAPQIRPIGIVSHSQTPGLKACKGVWICLKQDISTVTVGKATDPG